MQMSIKLQGQLLDLSSPKVMAIVNVSPDSFYTSWGQVGEQVLLENVQNALGEGADILDIGACSTRPGGVLVDATTEWLRLEPALRAIRHHFPKAIVSRRACPTGRHRGKHGGLGAANRSKVCGSK